MLQFRDISSQSNTRANVSIQYLSGRGSPNSLRRRANLISQILLFPDDIIVFNYHRLWVDNNSIIRQFDLRNLFKQHRESDNGPSPNNNLRMVITRCSRRKMSKIVWFSILAKYLMTRIGATYADENIIFRRKICCDIALAFASILSTYKYIDERRSDGWSMA
jgi:hypothetical protein